MPIINRGTSVPTKEIDHLAGYRCHGVNISTRPGSVEAIGDCPFCAKDGKFYVNVNTGQWSCKVCSSGTDKGGGNIYVFLRLMHSMGGSPQAELERLAEDRKLLYLETLTTWGVVKNPLTGEWVVPGYNPEGKLVQLYRYAVPPNSRTGKKALLATTGVGHGVFGLQNWEPRKSGVYVCEGPWDGMALFESLRSATVGDKGVLEFTPGESSSLYALNNVISVPGTNVMPDSWLPLFTGKTVNLMYDNDHPREVPPGSKKYVQAGLDACRRVSKLFAGYEEPPSEIRYLAWGPAGFEKGLPDGYDLRDHLSLGGEEPRARVSQLRFLIQQTQPIPAEWVPGRGAGAVKKGSTELEVLPCEDWKTLQNAWREAMKWTEGLDRALSMMLASAASVPVKGDQLWVKIISPPSGGKSSLCEALSIDKKHVLAKSTLRGFHSGYLSDKEGTEDLSLLNQLRDKTLVTKDGDTLLTSGNLPQILAEARDVYDRTSRASYRHGKGRDYDNISMTWILCGTSSLRQLDDSELGQRFLDCVIMENIDEELERSINRRKLTQFREMMRSHPSANGDGADGPEMTTAKRLTGGYLRHLRKNITELVSSVEATDEALADCDSYGTFVAYLRSRPSKKQKEEVSRELSTRLVMQMAKLAYCMAAVLGRKSIDQEVLRRVRQTALDTARGRTLQACRQLARNADKGMVVAELASLSHAEENEERDLLRFMRKIKVVESFRGVRAGPVRYRMTPTMTRLWQRVYEGKDVSLQD